MIPANKPVPTANPGAGIMADNPFVIEGPLRANISRAQSLALLIGVVFTALSLIEYFINPTQFFRSWMIGFLYTFALGLGSLACLMLQYMSGGAWGMVIRRQLEAGSRTIPYVTLFFLPILISVAMGNHSLYEWADAAKVQARPGHPGKKRLFECHLVDHSRRYRICNLERLHVHVEQAIGSGRGNREY